MNKENSIIILKIIAAIVISVIWLPIIPIYGAPFGGCEANGFLTLKIGCSEWPEFIRGFVFIIILSLICKKYISVAIIGLCVIGLISVLGGFELIWQGEIYRFQSVERLYFSVTEGFPLLFGGFIALLLGQYINKIRNNSEIENA